jgi:hypothetical protein
MAAPFRDSPGRLATSGLGGVTSAAIVVAREILSLYSDYSPQI